MLAGLVGSTALALSMNGTLAAFTASIQNSTNTAATGYLAMTETLLDSNGAATATICASNDGTPASVASNSATCSSINKYGGTGTGLTPGGASQTTRISLTNTGNVAASSFHLVPGSCTATAQAVNGGGSAGSVCDKIRVIITSGSVVLYSGSASALTSPVDVLAKLGTSSLAAGASVPVTVVVKLDAAADNTTSGFVVSQPLTWTMTA